MKFKNLPEFDKEFSKLKKKYRTLEKDLANLKKVLNVSPRLYPPHTFRIPDLGIKTEIYKLKHFRCAALKGKGNRSGIRIIYAYLEDSQKIVLIEIYYKDKDDRDCDKTRIKKHFP